MDNNQDRPLYVSQAIRTEAPYTRLPLAVQDVQLCRLLHASIGLCTEVGELLEAINKQDFELHILEEIGDLWWYTAILHDAISRKLWPYIGNIHQSSGKFHLLKIACATGNLQDVVKRSLFYGKPIDFLRIEKQTDLLVVHLVLLGTAFKILPCDAQDSNIKKLTARYPEKFSEEAAGDRDIEKERAALK